jgi:hypothetical protein
MADSQKYQYLSNQGFSGFWQIENLRTRCDWMGGVTTAKLEASFDQVTTHGRGVVCWRLQICLSAIPRKSEHSSIRKWSGWRCGDVVLSVLRFLLLSSSSKGREVQLNVSSSGWIMYLGRKVQVPKMVSRQGPQSIVTRVLKYPPLPGQRHKAITKALIGGGSAVSRFQVEQACQNRQSPDLSSDFKNRRIALCSIALSLLLRSRVFVRLFLSGGPALRCVMSFYLHACVVRGGPPELRRLVPASVDYCF